MGQVANDFELLVYISINLQTIKNLHKQVEVSTITFLSLKSVDTLKKVGK